MRPRFRRATTKVGAESRGFAPSTSDYGRSLGEILVCAVCGHGTVAASTQELEAAYSATEDADSLEEQAGQLATAARALEHIEKVMRPGRVIDLGCWTGSFLLAAQRRGWTGIGIEPSRWASEEARARGLDVRTGELMRHALPDASAELVVMGDVIEHLADPGAALDVVRNLLVPGGVFYATLPNAGSRLARLLGPRWWSVLPTHVQYFTPASLRRLLEEHGFSVRFILSHPKAFSAAYYAARLAGYSKTMGRAAVALTRLTRTDGLMIAPDFRDRMQVLAVHGSPQASA